MSTWVENRKWREDEKQFAIAKVAEGWTYAEVGRELSRHKDAVRAFFRRNNLSGSPLAAAIKREERKRSRKYGGSRMYRLGVPRPAVPAFVIEQRDARADEYRDLTAIFCGDPVPSRSALYQKLDSALPSLESTGPVVSLPDATGPSIHGDA